MAHRLVEQVLELHLVEVLVLSPETLGQLKAVVVLGRGPGGLEGDGALRGARLHRFQHIFWWQLELFGDLVHGRLATESRLQSLRRHIGALHRFLKPAWDLDRPALVPEVTLDFANDGGCGEGRKLESALRLEALDRREQADVADLDDVLERLAAVAEFLGYEDHQVVEQLDELLPDLGILRFLVLEEETTNELSVGSDGGRRRRRPVYSIRYLTILIRRLPVWSSTW